MEAQLNLAETIIPLEPSVLWLFTEYVSLLAIFIGAVLLFRHTKRPGVLMMLVGAVVYSLCILTAQFLFGSEASNEGFYTYLILFWPNIHIASVLTGCIGFLRFSVSFINES